MPDNTVSLYEVSPSSGLTRPKSLSLSIHGVIVVPVSFYAMVFIINDEDPNLLHQEEEQEELRILVIGY